MSSVKPTLAADSGAAPVSTSQTIATVERAADVLTLFARSTEPTLGVTEIAGELGLSKAAVHRILASLRSRGYVELDEEARRYALGPASLELGLSFLSRVDVRSIAAAELTSLSRLSQETATLSLLFGDGRMYVDQVTPAREIVMTVPLGQRFPLHAGASSKAMLAFLPEREVDRYLEGPLQRLTDNTLTSPERLREELALIRARGYATSQGERREGAASAAAPLLDHSGRPVGSISICGPADRLLGELDAVIALLLDATARVSARLGYRGGTTAP